MRILLNILSNIFNFFVTHLNPRGRDNEAGGAVTLTHGDGMGGEAAHCDLDIKIVFKYLETHRSTLTHLLLSTDCFPVVSLLTGLLL